MIEIFRLPISRTSTTTTTTRFPNSEPEPGLFWREKSEGRRHSTSRAFAGMAEWRNQVIVTLLVLSSFDQEIKSFITLYIHFEITGDPCNLIGSQQCDLFSNRTIFCSKSHLFPSSAIYSRITPFFALNRIIFPSSGIHSRIAPFLL